MSDSKFNCCWCGENAPVVAKMAKEMRRIHCDGMKERRPHPPTNIIIDVIEYYENDPENRVPSWYQVQTFDPDAPQSVYYNYQEYCRLRNPNGLPKPKDDENKHSKNRQDPNRPTFKCLLCGRKAKLNRKASAYVGIKDPANRVHVYKCDNEKAHKPVRFSLKRIVLDPKKDDPKGLPFAIDWPEAIDWKNWVDTFFENKIAGLKDKRSKMPANPIVRN